MEENPDTIKIEAAGMKERAPANNFSLS